MGASNLRDHASWRVWAALSGAVCVGLALRVPFLGHQSLGYEEAYTASIVAHDTLSGVWHAVEATESTPPLFYVMTWLWVKLIGSHSEVALRTVSLIAGVLTIPVAFLAVRRFVGTRIAVVTAWICAVSPLLVRFSLYARSYGLLLLVSAMSLWAFGMVLERPSWRRWMLWTLAGVVCLWTHYFTAFLLLAEVVVLFIRCPAARLATLAWSAVVCVGVAPLVSLFVTQSGATSRTDYIAGTPLATRLVYVVRHFAMGENPPGAWLEAAGLLFALAGLAVGGALVRRNAGARALAAVAVIAIGLPVLSAVTGIDDHLLSRNLAVAWLCLAALVAIGLARFRGWPLLAYGAVCIAAVLGVQSDWRYQAADWRGATRYLASRASGEPVAVMPGIQIVVAGPYLHRVPLLAPTTANDLWIMVEPERRGQRELAPVTDALPTTLWGQTLKATDELRYHGFRLIHLHAPSPVPIQPHPADNGPASVPRAFVLAR